MTVRIGINGFGRVGRSYLRALPAREASRGTPGIEAVAINDIAPVATLAHLLEYDSTYGRLPAEVTHDHRIAVTAHRDPAALDWSEYGTGIVIESTGRLRTGDQAAAHLKAGAATVRRPRRRPGAALTGRSPGRQSIPDALRGGRTVLGLTGLCLPAAGFRRCAGRAVPG
jgi:hypothetical protein